MYTGPVMATTLPGIHVEPLPLKLQAYTRSPSLNIQPLACSSYGINLYWKRRFGLPHLGKGNQGMILAYTQTSVMPENEL